MPSTPFDNAHLDGLLAEAHVDALLVTSKHGVRYMLNYYFFWFAHMEAVALSRYMPVVGYVPGRLDDAFYIGHDLEPYHLHHVNVWPPDVHVESWATVTAAEIACEKLAERGLDKGRIAVEMPFIAADAMDVIRTRLPHAEIVNAVEILEELRAVKSPHELELIRRAAEGIVDSMLELFTTVDEDLTTAQLVERLRQLETGRGLDFEYCLIATGTEHNRGPGPNVWHEGQPLSLDSGGSFGGYIGDMSRMAVRGEPSAELENALGQVEAVQVAAKQAVRAGITGDEIYAIGNQAKDACADAGHMRFVAHGMGLISHEAPRLTSTGRIRYPGNYTDRGIRSGMVLSIETDLVHPTLGFLKLEDTVIVEDDGHEEVAAHGRGWN